MPKSETPRERMSNALERMFHIVYRKNISPEEYDKFREQLDKFTNDLAKVSQQEAIIICKKLAEASMQGFERVEDDWSRLRREVEELQQQLSGLNEYLSQIVETLKAELQDDE